MPPPGICSDGTSVDTVKFTYIGLDCIEGNSNSQEEEFSCEDSNGGPPEGEEVLITCFDGNVVLASETVSLGGTITVPTIGSTGSLSSTLMCAIASIDGSTFYQTVTLDTSGTVDLYLGNEFGSLQLQACDDQDCIEEVTYFYLLENVGSTPMTITVLDRTRDGVTESFLDRLPTTELDIDESTVVTEMDTIDVCVKQLINITVNAEAEPPAGTPCFDSDMYSLQTDGTNLPPTPSVTSPPIPPVRCLSNLCVIWSLVVKSYVLSL